MKVVYNGCFGGFSLSHAGIMRYAELKGLKLYPFIDVRDGQGHPLQKYKLATDEEIKGVFCCVHYCATPEFSNESYWSGYDSMERSDPALVQTVEELGTKAEGQCAKPRIENVPSGALWRIDEYDGRESVMTRDDYDWKIAV